MEKFDLEYKKFIENYQEKIEQDVEVREAIEWIGKFYQIFYSEGLNEELLNNLLKMTLSFSSILAKVTLKTWELDKENSFEGESNG